MCVSVLRVVKQSCTGITEEELKRKCLEEGLTQWKDDLDKLESEGLVRRDSFPLPERIKPTNKAFV
jgi:hypothetical protein